MGDYCLTACLQEMGSPCWITPPRARCKSCSCFSKRVPLTFRAVVAAVLQDLRQRVAPLGRSVALHSLGELMRPDHGSGGLSRVELLTLVADHLRAEGGSLSLAGEMVQLELAAIQRSRIDRGPAESRLRTLVDAAVAASEDLYIAAARNDKAPRGQPSKEDKARSELEVCLRGLHLANAGLSDYAHPNIWEESQDAKSFEIDEALSRHPIPRCPQLNPPCWWSGCPGG